MKTFKRIERIRRPHFTNEHGQSIVIEAQGGNCTGMGGNAERIMNKVAYRIASPKSCTTNEITVLEAEVLVQVLQELIARAS